MKKNTLKTINDRKEFIKENESNIYTGMNEDGEEVIIFLEQNDGMIIKTRHANKPKYFECIEYDNDGYQLSVAYEPYES